MKIGASPPGAPGAAPVTLKVVAPGPDPAPAAADRAAPGLAPAPTAADRVGPGLAPVPGRDRAELGLGPAPATADPAELGLSLARADIYRRLADTGTGQGVAGLARQTGLHENTVREHLDALVRTGLAERNRGPVQGRGRPAWVYTARPDRALTGRAREYAGLATALAGQIARASADPEADAVAAGEAWGRELAGQGEATSAAGRAGHRPGGRPGRAGTPPGHRGVTDQVDRVGRAGGPPARRRVIDLFDRLGFAPHPDDAGATVRLTRCPLLEIARRQPEIVCAVHLGLARGILLVEGASPEGIGLRPFVEPGACRLDLTPL